MLTEKDFDNIIKAKLDEREFPFDEHNWEKAEALIIRSQNLKRSGRIAAIFTGGFLLGMAVMIPFMNKNNAAASISNNAPQSNRSLNTLYQNANPLIAQNNIAAKPAIAGINNNTNSNNVISKPVIPATVKSFKSVTSEGNANSQAAISQYALLTPYPKEIPNQNPDNVKDVTFQYKDLTELPSINQLTVSAPESYTLKGEIQNIPIIQKKLPVYTNPLQKPDNMVSIDGGFLYSFGWRSSEGYEAKGITPLIGFSVTHYLSNRIALSIGIQYINITNMTSSYSSTRSYYDYGVTDTTTSVNLKTLHYISAPVIALYSIDYNDQIGAGANLMYLINTTSVIDKYAQTPFSSNTYSSSKEYGYMDGLNPYDIDATLEYKRRLGNYFSLTAAGYLGLMGIKSNSFFNTNEFARNNGIKVTVSYNIIKWKALR